MDIGSIIKLVSGFDPAGQAASNRPQDKSIFSSAMNYVQNNQDKVNDGNLDVKRMEQTQKQLYGAGGSKAPDANDIGATAVMDVLKKLTGSGGDVSQKGAQNPAQFQALAMEQASHLFEKQSANGNLRDGTDKQSAVTSAAMMAVKMFAQSQFAGSSGGGGGAGGLLQLAGKLLSG